MGLRNEPNAKTIQIVMEVIAISGGHVRAEEQRGHFNNTELYSPIYLIKYFKIFKFTSR